MRPKLAMLMQARPPGTRTRCTSRQVDEMRQLLGWFLTYHLDTALNSRDIAFDVLSRKILRQIDVHRT